MKALIYNVPRLPVADRGLCGVMGYKNFYQYLAPNACLLQTGGCPVDYLREQIAVGREQIKDIWKSR